MRTEKSLTARDEACSRHAPVEIRPTFVMTVDRYKEWSNSGQEGERQIADAFDQVVVDLVEKHKIVGKDREGGLREWLAVHICPYFMFKLLLERRLTINQESKCRKKIAKAGDDLLRELSLLFNLGPAEMGIIFASGSFEKSPREYPAAMDWLELKNILLRAEKWEPSSHTTRARNAAKPALKDLGDDIRCFWVTGWTNWLEDPKMPLEAPAISAGSDYVQFAKYIYAFVKENCEEEGVIARLKAVEDDRRVLLLNDNREYQNLWKILESHYGQAGHKKQA